MKYFFFGLKKMSFLCMMILSLNRKQIPKRKKSNLVKKNVQNIKNTVKGILWFYNKMPDKKPEDPTEILAWKVSLPLISNKVIDKLFPRSIDKGLINNKKELTMTFVRDIIVRKITFGDVLLLPDVYGN